MFSRLVAVESAPANMEAMPLRPARSLTKTYPAVPQGDTMFFELERPATHSGIGTDTVTPVTPGFPSGTATPNGLEMSCPAGLDMGHEEGFEALQSSMHRTPERKRARDVCYHLKAAVAADLE